MIKLAIEGLALESPPVPISSTCRQVKQFANANCETTPNYWTVYRVIRALPERLLALAHNGAKAYGEGF
jgi:putative transposase